MFNKRNSSHRLRRKPFVLVTVAKKHFPLTGRNLEQNQTQCRGRDGEEDKEKWGDGKTWERWR